LEAVRTLAHQVRERVDHLDILVLNAGARFDAYEETSAGIERTFATNHLGHFLLTGLLVDLLLAAPAARVVVTGSSAHAGAPAVGGGCSSAKDWDRKAAYARSKLANIMFAYELARRTAGTGITSHALDPGGVATRLGLNNGFTAWLRHLLYYALKRQLLSARKGADTLVYLATDESLRGRTGRYYRQRREIRSSPASYDEARAGDLWRLSVQMSGLGDHLDGLSEQARDIMLR
jgi:NAD(P)-dependent dehydrogenase (short-subunit alcohol dehydrogenase family)